MQFCEIYFNQDFGYLCNALQEKHGYPKENSNTRFQEYRIPGTDFLA